VTRRIVSVRTQATGGPPVDNFVARIVKYVPADIVAAWLAVAALLAGTGARDRAVLWSVFGVLLVVTPVWTLRVTRVPDKGPAVLQAVVATVAFAVWVFATGVPFSGLAFYSPKYGGVAIILFTLLSGLVTPPRADEPAQP
jgi:hypothetical protein